MKKIFCFPLAAVISLSSLFILLSPPVNLSIQQPIFRTNIHFNENVEFNLKTGEVEFEIRCFDEDGKLVNTIKANYVDFYDAENNSLKFDKIKNLLGPKEPPKFESCKVYRSEGFGETYHEITSMNYRKSRYVRNQ